jgi:hypothetical protein
MHVHAATLSEADRTGENIGEQAVALLFQRSTTFFSRCASDHNRSRTK